MQPHQARAGRRRRRPGGRSRTGTGPCGPGAASSRVVDRRGRRGVGDRHELVQPCALRRDRPWPPRRSRCPRAGGASPRWRDGWARAARTAAEPGGRRSHEPCAIERQRSGCRRRHPSREADRPAGAEATGDRRGRRCARRGRAAAVSAFSCGTTTDSDAAIRSSAPKIGAATLTSGCGTRRRRVATGPPGGSRPGVRRSAAGETGTFSGSCISGWASISSWKADSAKASSTRPTPSSAAAAGRRRGRAPASPGGRTAARRAARRRRRGRRAARAGG